MKIVIDLPESTFKKLVRYGEPLSAGNAFHDSILNAVAHGTVLPKGHGDLIDRDDVRTDIKKTCDSEYCDIGFDNWERLRYCINHTNTVIPADKGEE